MRASLLSWMITTETSYEEPNVDLQQVINFAENMQEGTMQLGFVLNDSGCWLLTIATKRHYAVFQFVFAVSACVFMLSDCVGR